MSSVRVIKANAPLTKKNEKGEKVKIRVAAYCRVSTDSEEQISSYESQVKYYKELISSKEDWTLVKIFADEAISGTKVDKREDFQKMIMKALGGEIDLILTKSISRFARNTVDTLKYVRLLKEKNVAVFFEEENINTMTMDGELLLTILSSVAQQEVHNTSEHVKKGLKMKMQRGELVGYQECLGYDYDQKTKTISVNKEEAKIVKYIFKRYLEGAGANTIARELSELGYKTKKGATEWWDSSVISIIKNEKYKGDLLLGKTFTVDPINKRRLTNKGESDKFYLEDHHEGIIDPETFDKAQELLEKRACPRRPRNQYDRLDLPRKYALSCMCTCGFCGGTLTRRVKNGGEMPNGKEKRVWQCVTATKRGKRFCQHSLALDEAMIEQAFVEGMNRLVGEDNKKLLNGFLNTVESIISDDTCTGKIKKLEAKLEDLQKKKDNVLELKISGIIETADCEKKYSAISSEIEITEKELKELHEKAEDGNKTKERLAVFKDELLSHQKMTEFDREVFEAAVQRVIVGEESKGVIDPFMMNFILKSSFSEPGSVRDIDASKVMAIDEFEIDYRHFVFAKGDDGFKTKKILPKAKVRFSLDIGSHGK